MVKLKGWTLATSREGLYFWLCTKDRMECEETGQSVHSGVRDPNHTKALSFFQSSVRKLLGDLRGGGEAGGCD